MELSGDPGSGDNEINRIDNVGYRKTGRFVLE